MDAENVWTRFEAGRARARRWRVIYATIDYSSKAVILGGGAYLMFILLNTMF